jgi:hypothetical protein
MMFLAWLEGAKALSIQFPQWFDIRVSANELDQPLGAQ